MAGDLEVDYSEPGGPEQMEVTEAAQTSTEVQAASGHNQTPEGVSTQATNPEAAQASQQVPVKEEPKTETTEGQKETQESQTPKEEREESQKEKTSTEVKRKTLDVEASTRGGTGGSQNPVTPPKAAQVKAIPVPTGATHKQSGMLGTAEANPALTGALSANKAKRTKSC